MIPAWHVCVLVPARNEEELLPRCLTSIVAAREFLPAEVTCDIVVAVDASTDETAAVASHLLAKFGTVVLTHESMVGSARAAAARAALLRYQGPLSRCWLAHTDADCIVPKDWLVQQLDLANDDFKAVAGIVSVDTFSEHGAHVEDRFRQTYLIGADGKHPHVHGANLGVRADLYSEVGGWSALPTAEDHDLWNRLRLASASCVSTTRLKVITSGRRVGRAPLGFAAALAAHNEAVA